MPPPPRRHRSPGTGSGSFPQEPAAPGVCRGPGAICRSSEPRKATGHHRARLSEPPASPGPALGATGITGITDITDITDITGPLGTPA
ncbi:hypothetical protein TURU_157810 [Turdus rufiventris]|nr:hypothetical protein TURU_157810 [Turdus rufiventris]